MPKARDVLFDGTRKRAHTPGLFRDTGLLLEAWCAACASSGIVDADLVGDYIAGTARGLGLSHGCSYVSDGRDETVISLPLPPPTRPGSADAPQSDGEPRAAPLPLQHSTALELFL
jgi:hypothetical protein